MIVIAIPAEEICLRAVMPAAQVCICIVIYGQEVLYAARGQEARSRPAKAGIQWFRLYIPA